MAESGTRAVVERVFREEYGRIIAGLVARFGDLDLAEECAQEAFAEALRRWPGQGTPTNPGAWLTTTARHRGIDRIRREASRDGRHVEAHRLQETTATELDDAVAGPAIGDDRLELIFTCCHPVLAVEARVALTLRLLGGLSVAEIGRGFLVGERTMAQRITRAKRKIATARIPYRVPEDHELPDRLPAVLTTLYLIFTEGYLPSDGERSTRVELAAEAVRLARILAGLMPDEPEVHGLLALMILIEARRPARFAEGMVVRLDEQDRALWDRAAIAEGHAMARRLLAGNRPGPYQLMAMINAIHDDALRAADTDWSQILTCYDQLHALQPTPIVALNRAVAVAELEGAEAGLALVEPLVLTDYHPWHAARADLLARAGRGVEAVAAYDRAIDLAPNPAERAYLATRRDRGAQPHGPSRPPGARLRP